jgi:beta-glucosidase
MKIQDHIEGIVSQLPKDFIFGTATSAYQVEGAAFLDGKKASIWDDFVRLSGTVKNGDTADIGCDHYHHYADDIALLADLGANAYRFSISWPRILPDGIGAINLKGIDFYKRLLDELHKKHIAPYATLYHWDLPATLQQKGGWTNRSVLHWFEEYVDAIIKHLGQNIPNFIVLNEPAVISYVGHYEGIHAPGMKNPEAMYATMHHLNMVHGQSYQQIKSALKGATVASTYTHFPIYPIDDRPESAKAADLMMSIWSDGFFGPLFKGEYPTNIVEAVSPYIQAGDLEMCRQPGDFLGLNHYCPDYAKPVNEAIPARLTFAHNAGKIDPIGTTDLGWPIVPNGLYDSLIDLKKRYNPARIIITEGGCAFNDAPDKNNIVHDQRRIDYYAAYLQAALKARADGVPLDGYFAWSFLDNFEWAEGFGPRFGLVYIDYLNDLKRIPKNSFFWFKELIREHKLRSAA